MDWITIIISFVAGWWIGFNTPKALAQLKAGIQLLEDKHRGDTTRGSEHR